MLQHTHHTYTGAVDGSLCNLRQTGQWIIMYNYFINSLNFNDLGGSTTITGTQTYICMAVISQIIVF